MKRLMLWVLMSAVAGVAFAGEAVIASGPARRGVPEVGTPRLYFQLPTGQRTRPCEHCARLNDLRFAATSVRRRLVHSPLLCQPHRCRGHDDGDVQGWERQPPSVPLIGVGAVSSQTITLNPNGAVLFEAPNSGGLQQGWGGSDTSNRLHWVRYFSPICFGTPGIRGGWRLSALRGNRRPTSSGTTPDSTRPWRS